MKPELVARIRRYLMKKPFQEIKTTDFLSQIPPRLRYEVISDVHKNIKDKIPFLKDKSLEFSTNFLEALRVILYIYIYEKKTYTIYLLFIIYYFYFYSYFYFIFLISFLSNFLDKKKNHSPSFLKAIKPWPKEEIALTNCIILFLFFFIFLSKPEAIFFFFFFQIFFNQRSN